MPDDKIYLKVVHAAGCRLIGYGIRQKGGVFALPKEIGENLLVKRPNTFELSSEAEYNRVELNLTENKTASVGSASTTDDTEADKVTGRRSTNKSGGAN